MPKFFHHLCCCVRLNVYANTKDAETVEDGRLEVQSPLNQCSKPLSSHQPHSNWKQKKARHKHRSPASNFHQFSTVSNQVVTEGAKTTHLKNGFNQGSRKVYENGLIPVLTSLDDCLLPQISPRDLNKKCLIVDLDETLVHSSFKPVKNADFIIPVEIDNVVHQVYVLKRPNTDEFLERIGDLFECVLFTASLAKYADPVADNLDKRKIFRSRLFREACVYCDGNYVKDLNKLGRDLNKVIIIDNSPASYAFHPNNAIAVKTWFDDPNDNELLNLLPFLEILSTSDEIFSILGRRIYSSENDNNNNDGSNIIHQSFQTPLSNTSPITQCLPPQSTIDTEGGSWRHTLPSSTTRLQIGGSSPIISSTSSVSFSSNETPIQVMSNQARVQSTVHIMLTNENTNDHPRSGRMLI